MKTAKEQTLEVLNNLPDTAELEEIIQSLYIRLKFEKGIRDIEEGRGVPHEEAGKRLGKWLK